MTVQDIINSVIDQKPAVFKTNFDDEMVQRISDAIGGKKAEMAQSYLGVQKPEDDVEAEALEAEEVDDNDDDEVVDSEETDESEEA